MQTYNNSVVLKFDDNTTGNADSGAPVTVRVASVVPGSGALATIYDNQGTQILNPLTTDTDGNYSFKAADGVYDIVVREDQASQYIIQNETLDGSLSIVTQRTTAELVSSTTVFDISYVVTTSGSGAAGDGGSSSWLQNGVVGQTPGQSPIDLGLNLLNDGNGDQWGVIRGQTIDFTAIQFFPLPFGGEGPGSYTYTTNGFKKVITSKSTEWNNILDRHRLQVIAHRGFMTTYPQNTMIAFTSAINSGASALECDVQVTSDGVPVVFHDDTVDSLTNGTGAISALTLVQVQSLTFDSTVGTILSLTRIPTFADVLNYCKTAGIELYPEIKRFRTRADIQLMVDDVESANMEFQTFFQSFSIDDLIFLRGINKNVALGLTANESVQATYESLIDSVAAIDGNLIYWQRATLLSNPAIVTYANSKGLDVVAWTVNEFNDAKLLMLIGVNKIMSNINIEVI